MGRGLVVCGIVLLVGAVGAAPGAEAFPGAGATRTEAARPDWPIERVQAGIGYWRKRYDRAQYRRYRGNPGAQSELRQKRRNLCRNVPEMC